MKTIFPERLKSGDKVMIVAPSDSLALISDKIRLTAMDRFEQLGLKLSFAKNVEKLNEFDSSDISLRIDDLHEAFSDSTIKGVFTAFGGYNCNQLLQHIDWNIIKDNPKIFVGFSDTTALQNAIFAKTGLVTYSGPSFARFGQELYFEYTLEYFKKCILETNEFKILPSESWSDDWWLKDQENRILKKNDGWIAINSGEAVGNILGANLSTFNLLQGSEFFPDISNSILFLEDDAESKLPHFDRDLQSILHLPNFKKVRGIVIGRFQDGSDVHIDQLRKMIKSKRELDHIPVLANLDFGHTDPMFTFPIGGEAHMIAKEGKSQLAITKH